MLAMWTLYSQFVKGLYWNVLLSFFLYWKNIQYKFFFPHLQCLHYSVMSHELHNCVLLPNLSLIICLVNMHLLSLGSNLTNKNYCIQERPSSLTVLFKIDFFWQLITLTSTLTHYQKMQVWVTTSTVFIHPFSQPELCCLPSEITLCKK